MIDLYDQELIETWSEIRNERNFNADYFDNHRGAQVLPGPFADKEAAEKPLFRFGR